MKKYFFSIFIFCLSCDISSSKPIDNPDPVFSISSQNFEGLSKAYFASGCFWCVETIYESLDGVKEVYSGYAGGSSINPNYYQVMSGKTGHAEAIEIIYDSSVISFDTLLKVFFEILKVSNQSVFLLWKEKSLQNAPGKNFKNGPPLQKKKIKQQRFLKLATVSTSICEAEMHKPLCYFLSFEITFEDTF